MHDDDVMIDLGAATSAFVRFQTTCAMLTDGLRKGERRMRRAPAAERAALEAAVGADARELLDALVSFVDALESGSNPHQASDGHILAPATPSHRSRCQPADDARPDSTGESRKALTV